MVLIAKWQDAKHVDYSKAFDTNKNETYRYQNQILCCMQNYLMLKLHV